MTGYTGNRTSETSLVDVDVRGVYGETPEEYIHMEGDFDYAFREERDNLQKRMSGLPIGTVLV